MLIRINGLISTLDWRPVVYQYRHLKREEMIAHIVCLMLH